MGAKLRPAGKSARGVRAPSARVLRRDRTEAKKQRRAELERALGAKIRALPDRKFGVILADPAVPWKAYGEGGMDRAPENHYATTPVEELEKLAVESIAAKDCVLLIWATAPALLVALELIKAWGFSYRSHFVWLKDRQGLGYWARNEHELVLIGTRGHPPAPAMGTQSGSVFRAPLTRHSEKPPTVHEWVERHYPNLPKVELFARAGRPGWSAWGAETPEAPISVDEAEEMMFEPSPAKPLKSPPPRTKRDAEMAELIAEARRAIDHHEAEEIREVRRRWAEARERIDAFEREQMESEAA